MVTSLEQRRSRGQLPPAAGRPRPGSRAARRHRPWPGSPRPPHRPGPGRPAGSQVTAAPTAYSHPGGPGIPWREAGARHGSDAASQRRDRGASPVRSKPRRPARYPSSSTPRPGAHRCCLRWRSYARHRWPSRSPSSRRPARTARAISSDPAGRAGPGTGADVGSVDHPSCPAAPAAPWPVSASRGYPRQAPAFRMVDGP